MKQFDDYFLTDLILKSNIEFISGKFFYEENDIKNIDISIIMFTFAPDKITYRISNEY